MKVLRLFFAGAMLCSLSSALGQGKGAPPAGHSSHSPATGTSKIPAQKPEEFIKLDPSAPKTVLLTLIAAHNDANYGMNFNGYAKGNAVVIIPKGWTVKATFRNQSPVPHSVLVVEKPMVKRMQMGEPYFKGASTPNPVKGTTGAPVNFQFVADEAGDFALACGFPAHAANGHWIAMEVSETASAPSFRTGEAEPFVAK